MAETLRRGALIGAALMTWALGSVGAAQASPGGRFEVTIDRQGDVDTSGLPSVYSPTPGDSYVGVVAGQQQSYALLHLDLSTVPDLAAVTKVELRVARDPADTRNELRPAGAALQACPVRGTWVAGRQTIGPTVDCHAPITARPEGTDGFVLDLSPMLVEWQSGRQDGIALLAVADPTATWRISLRQSRSTAVVLAPDTPLSTPTPNVTPVPSTTEPAPPGPGSALITPPLRAFTPAPSVPLTVPAPSTAASPVAVAFAPPPQITVASASSGALSALGALALTALAAVLGFALPAQLRRRGTTPPPGSPA